MKIVDLTTEYEPTFLACLKDWDRNAEGACHKACWRDMIECKGLRVKLALDDDCINAGLTDYPPPIYEGIVQKDVAENGGHTWNIVNWAERAWTSALSVWAPST